MFLPVEYAWAQPVVVATIIVFVISWIGNSILSRNNFLNALVTAVVFALIFGALAYFRLATLSVTFPGREPVATTEPAPAPPVPPANPVTTVPTK